MAILRIATKYVMPRVREWSIAHLKNIFPSSLDELLKPPTGHLTRSGSLEPWRTGQTAVDLILLSGSCDTPAFLPYAYYVLASSDWSDRQNVESLGLDRLDQDVLLSIAIGREYLQREVVSRWIQGGGTTSGPFTFHVPVGCEGTCQGVTFRSSETSLEYIYRNGSIIEWILISGRRHEKRSHCNPCTKAYTQQGRARVREIFDQFCRIVKLKDETSMTD